MARLIENTITFPYKRSLGPVVGPFMTALTDKRILGVRHGDEVLVPPMEWDPATGAELPRDFVEVGPAGVVESWTWVPTPSEQHPLDSPFAFAFIRLDGATTPLLHAVDAGSPDAMAEGLRVAPRWRGTRVGRIDDIICFVPGEEPEVEGDDAGPADEDVTRMDYAASITNFTIVTPVQYPGQTETEPFVRAFVLLDGVDVILYYQPVIELPADTVRVGQRVSAVWASPGESDDEGGGMGGAYGDLLGWMLNGEPDVDDPDLVNRIF